LGIVDDDAGDGGPVGALAADHLRAEPLEQLALDFRIAPEQTVDDLVTRPRRGAVACERFERRALAGADSTSDRDCERPLRVSARRKRARREPALRRSRPNRPRRLRPLPHAPRPRPWPAAHRAPARAAPK